MLASLASWFIPGGQILSALATAAGVVLKFFGWLVETLLDGFTRMLANPTTFVVVLVVALGAYGAGIRRGVLWDAHKVEKAVQALVDVTRERDGAYAEIKRWKTAIDDQKKETEDAKLARDKAMGEARGARAAAASAQRLLDAAGGAAKTAKKAPQAGVLALPILPWGSK